MMYGVEVKPKGKRKFKRLSVSMHAARAMKAQALAHVSQYCADQGIDLTTTQYRVVNRDTDGIIAVSNPNAIH